MKNVKKTTSKTSKAAQPVKTTKAAKVTKPRATSRGKNGARRPVAAKRTTTARKPKLTPMQKRLKAFKRRYTRLVRNTQRWHHKTLKQVRKSLHISKKTKRPVKKATSQPVKKRFLTPKRAMLLGLILIIIGIAGAAPTVYYTLLHKGTADAQPFSAHVPSTAVSKPTRQAITGTPVSMSLPSVWINNLSVIPGVYDAQTQEWTLTLDKAQFATITTKPNDLSGQTFIYGHYRPEVFAYLHHIVPGAEATVDTDNGYRFTYVFKTTFAVAPTDTSVFSYQGAPILTIQTCSGTWFQNRQMYQFDFEKVEKI